MKAPRHIPVIFRKCASALRKVITDLLRHLRQMYREAPPRYVTTGNIWPTQDRPMGLAAGSTHPKEDKS